MQQQGQPQRQLQQLAHPSQRSQHIPAPLGPLMPLTPNALRSQISPASPPPPAPSAASPPNKRDLKSWWKNFKLQSKNNDIQEQPRGIFGVPLRESILYANVAISLVDENGKSYIYGYVPIVVAKSGVFLKEKATEVEGIFRLSGSEKRIKELKLAFDSPERYGKGLSWNGYTVHDAANVLRRYLNDLPEPVVPLAFYEPFREPLRNAIIQGSNDADGPQFIDGFDMNNAIAQYQALITELPPLNRQLLLYILDLLAVFAAKADMNRMNSQNLAAIFQPGILSHPHHAMAPGEYRLNQTVLIFLIENQDHFIIGMRGTAVDERTVQEVQKATPPVTPGFPGEMAGTVGVSRTASNASAGAESVARDGKIRRNRSTSSRKSRHSRNSPQANNNSAAGDIHVGRAATPRSSSPALATTPTPSVNGSSSGLARSNTMPARSPGLSAGRFPKRSDASGSPVTPLTPINAHGSSHMAPTVESVAEVVTPGDDEPTVGPFAPAVAPPQQGPLMGLGLSSGAPASPEPSQATHAAADPSTSTPSKDRLAQIFQRSTFNEGHTPNKLRKKRLPSSTSPSAQSSTTSLRSASAYTPPNHDPSANILEGQAGRANMSMGALLDDSSWEDHRKAVEPSPDGASESTPRVSQVPSIATIATITPTPSAVAGGARASETSLRPHKNSPSTSLHSSFNEGSDIDQVDEVPAALPNETPNETPEKTKKRLWRLSKRRDDMQQPSLAPPAGGQPSTSNLSATSTPPDLGSSLGSNVHAGISSSSIGSGGLSLVGAGTQSLTGASGSSDSALANAEAQASQDSGKSDGKDEPSKGKLSGWLKSKYRGTKESAEQRRNKPPSPTDQSGSTSSLAGVLRGKSLDISRATEDNDKPAQ